MPGASVTDLNVQNNLQIEYGKRLNEQLNRRIALWNKMPKSDAPMQGMVHKDYAVIGYPASGGTIGWERPLPTADRSKTRITSIYDNFAVYPISISWATVAKTGDKASFVPILTQEMSNLRHFAELDMERMLFGDGSGRIGFITQLPTGTLALPTAGNWYAEVPWWVIPRVMIGHRYGFGSGTSSGTIAGETNYECSESMTIRPMPVVDGYYEVVDVLPNKGINSGGTALEDDAAHGVIQFKQAAPGGHGIVAGDVMFKHTSIITDAIGAGTHAATEVMGLKGIVSDSAPPMRAHTFDTYPAAGTLQGLDPTTNSWFKSQVVDASTDLDDVHFDQLNERYDNYGSVPADEVTEYWCNPRIKRKLLANKYGGVRVPVTGGDSPDIPVGQASTMSESMMNKTVKVNGRPLRTHRYIEPDRVYAMTPYIYKYINREFSFDKPQLSMGWHQNFDRLPNSDNEAWAICNVGTTRRNALGLIKNISAT